METSSKALQSRKVRQTLYAQDLTFMLLLWCSPNRTNMYSVLLVIRFLASILRKEKPPPYLWTTFAGLFIAH